MSPEDTTSTVNQSHNKHADQPTRPKNKKILLISTGLNIKRGVFSVKIKKVDNISVLFNKMPINVYEVNF